MDEVREVFRLRHYSYRTEESYITWIERFILFHDKRHPRELGAEEIQWFQSDVAVRDKGIGVDAKPGHERLAFLLKTATVFAPFSS